MSTAIKPLNRYNHELCARCQGHCCKSNPGATSPEDWGAPNVTEMIRRIADGLDSGRWVVMTAPKILTKIIMPLKTDTGCAFLHADGCEMSDEERPEGCRTLSPNKRFPDACEYPTGVTADGKRTGVEYFGWRWVPHQYAINEAIKESEARAEAKERERKRERR